MTADIKLLPLPKREQLANPYAHVFGSVTAYGHTDETLTTYARAVAEHNVAARDTQIAQLEKANEQLHAHGERMHVEIETLRAEVSGLHAARIAYASEFPETTDGDPDTGNIHANIRALKAENKRLRAEVERLVLEAEAHHAARLRSIAHAERHCARAERLAEALRGCRDWFEAQAKSISKGNGSSWDLMQVREQRDLCNAALRDHDQEGGDA